MFNFPVKFIILKKLEEADEQKINEDIQNKNVEIIYCILDELKKAIEEYIKYYNEKKINVKRKGLSPLAYRQQSLS